MRCVAFCVYTGLLLPSVCACFESVSLDVCVAVFVQVLDGYLYAKGTLTAFGAGGDLAGNLTFIALSMLGVRHLRRAGKDE